MIVAKLENVGKVAQNSLNEKCFFVDGISAVNQLYFDEKYDFKSLYLHEDSRILRISACSDSLLHLGNRTSQVIYYAQICDRAKIYFHKIMTEIDKRTLEYYKRYTAIELFENQMKEQNVSYKEVLIDEKLYNEINDKVKHNIPSNRYEYPATIIYTDTGHFLIFNNNNIWLDYS